METEVTEKINLMRIQQRKDVPMFKADENASWRCGNAGHWARNCTVTKGKECKKCGKIGHFQRVCRSRLTTTSNPSKWNRKQPQQEWRQQKSKSRKGNVRLLKTSADETEDDTSAEYVLSLLDGKCYQVEVLVNTKPMKFIVDTGASVNVLTKKMWNRLRNPTDELSKTDVKVFAYASEKPLQLLGQWTTTVELETVKVKTTFVVVNGEYPCLLGKSVSVELGIVVFANQVSMVSNDLPTLLEENDHLFKGIGKLVDFEAKVEIMENAQPVVQPIRRTPYHLREKIEQELERLLALDVIEKVQGPTPWLTPIVAVPKPDGSVRICLDMRVPNEVIVKQKFPIPLIDEVIQKFEGANVFSELDFAMGYHQIPLEENSRAITTFATESGVYRYKRLMFGMTVSPELFQYAIQDVLKDCSGIGNISDNIIVHGKTEKEHNENLKKVFNRLTQKGLKLNKAKCKFGMKEVEFMGHIVSANGVQLGKAKVKDVLMATEPKSVSELRSFLGLVNYCAKFIPNVAEKTEKLRQLIKKNVKWNWSPEHTSIFEELKSAIANCATLAYFKADRSTKLVVDASPSGLGAILMQKQSDGNWRPIAFASKVLTETERRFSQTEKEALSVIWGCEKFHLYLYGKEFEIVTDHKPLEVIYSPHSRPSARIERWLLRLQQYKYQIRYEKGESNLADSLSRLVSEKKEHKNDDMCNVNEYIQFVTIQAVPKSMTLEDIESATREDAQLQKVKCSLSTDQWDDSVQQFKNVKEQLSWHKGILLKENRIVLPDQLRKHALEIAHEAHQGIVRTKAVVRSKIWWPGVDKDVENLIKGCIACQVQGKLDKPEPIISTDWNENPMDNIALDICGPFPNGEYLTVLVDYVSKWPEAMLTKTVTSSVIIKWLENVFACHGYPNCLTTDNGPQFVSKEFRDFLQHCGIKHRRVTPYWPQANGQVERLNQVFLKAFKAAKIEGMTMQDALVSLLRVYRNTPHYSTKVTPSEVIFGRQIRTKLPVVKTKKRKGIVKKAVMNDRDAKEKSKSYADCSRKAKTSDVTKGDAVLLKQSKVNKLTPNFSTQLYEVVAKKGNCVTLRDKRTNKLFTRNVTHVKKFSGKESSCRNAYIYDSDTDDDVNEKGDDAKKTTVERLQARAENRPQRVRSRPVRFGIDEYVYH